MLSILTIIALWKILEKSGEKGWKILIPFYGEYVLFKQFYDKKLFWIMFIAFIVGILLCCASFVFCPPIYNSYCMHGFNYCCRSMYWHYAPVCSFATAAYVLFSITAVAYVVFTAMLRWHIGEAFGVSGLFGLALILLPTLAIIVLGLDSSKVFSENKRPNCFNRKKKEEEKEEKEEKEDNSEN